MAARKCWHDRPGLKTTSNRPSSTRVLCSFLKLALSERVRYGGWPNSVHTLGDQSALVLSLKPQIEDGSDTGAREEHVVGYLDLRKRSPLRRRLVPRFRLHGAPWTPPADDAMDG